MKQFEQATLHGHGFAFLVSKNRFGYNISHQGKWIWRAKTTGEVRKMVNKFGLAYMKEIRTNA